MWLKLQWVAPVLKHRTVTAYEVQMCEPSGPRQNSVSVFTNRKNSDASAALEVSEDVERAAGGGYEFYTVDDTVRENHTIIRNLRPGIRYQFRVRPQIDNIWCNMNLLQMSDVVAVPASSPDAPTAVAVCELVPTIYRRPTTGATITTADTEYQAGEVKESFDLSETAVSIHYIDDMKIPAVAHNSILISWMNGNPNGSPIIDNAIEMARVRDYSHSDSVLGLDSSGKLPSGQFSGNILNLSSRFDASITESETDNENIEIDSSLDWIDVSQGGQYISPTSFRVLGLLAGCAYIFRIRQRNSIGWSTWSLASDTVKTLASAPPCAPVATHVGSYHVVLEWTDMDDQFNYTILDFELQVALLPPGKRNNTNSTDHDDSSWDVQLEWSVPEARRHDSAEVGAHQTMIKSVKSSAAASAQESKQEDIYADHFNCRCVFIDKLSPMSMYVARVKVRTVTGWSAWSGIGKPFRTLSPP